MPRPFRNLVRACRASENGALSVELVAYVPLLALITLVIVQGFLAVSVLASAQTAARDGARAAMTGRSVSAAVNAALPDWSVVEEISTGCPGATCVSVTVRVPIGVPAVTTSTLTVTRTASFPERD